MSTASILLLDNTLMSAFYFGPRDKKSQAIVAKNFLREGRYTNAGTMAFVGMEGSEVAEEVFDLTNNPCRQDEREAYYGNGRSLSVGDVEIGRAHV